MIDAGPRYSMLGLDARCRASMLNVGPQCSMSNHDTPCRTMMSDAEPRCSMLGFDAQCRVPIPNAQCWAPMLKVEPQCSMAYLKAQELDALLVLWNRLTTSWWVICEQCQEIGFQLRNRFSTDFLLMINLQGLRSRFLADTLIIIDDKCIARIESSIGHKCITRTKSSFLSLHSYYNWW